MLKSPRATAKDRSGRVIEVDLSIITKTRTKMRDPSHAGEILRDRYLKPMDVTITLAADALGVTRKRTSTIVNGHAPVTPDMAMRLAVVFGTEPELWVNLPAQYDLWQVSRTARPKVKPLGRAA